MANTTLDIKTSTVFIKYANVTADPISLIKGYLQNGFANNTWTGTATVSAGSIRSSNAALNPSDFAVGYADSADVGNPATIATANTIELRYAGVGDTNLNGTVDINDYNAVVVRHFGNNVSSPAAPPAETPAATLAIAPPIVTPSASANKTKKLMPKVVVKTLVPERHDKSVNKSR